MKRAAVLPALAVLLTVAALVLPRGVSAATGITTCEVGKSCTVGEFLYDDNYIPITTATCALTSRYPGGSFLYNNQALTSTSDGWYAQDFTTPSTTGTYRSQICCTAGSDYLCLDKSFDVKEAGSVLTATDVTTAVWDAARSSHTTSGSFGAALQNVVPTSSDVASATWNYSSRSLSTFGNLVSDIWGNSSRSLTGFGTLIADIWANSTGTQTTKDITDLKKTAKETRLLLEQLVNKPVVETTTEEVPDLTAKISETEGVANQLSADVAFSQSKIDLLKLRWSSLSDEEVEDTISELTRKLGGQNDTAQSSSILGAVAYLSDSWDWTEVTTVKTQVGAIRDLLVALSAEVLSTGHSSTSANQVKALSGIFAQLDGSVGSYGDKATLKTLFGRVAETKLIAATLADQTKDLDGVLASWDKESALSRQKKLDDLGKAVAAVNRIPTVGRTLLATTPLGEKEMRNKGYYISGIISANQRLLASKSGRPLANTWLELGSIVFKSLVTNPSALISQKVVVNYFLPEEVKQDNVVSVDDGLTIKYDTAKNQYYVTGEFLLAPSETRVVAVRVADMWQISAEEIDSLRQQASVLSKPLEKTSYFAQGVTLKSDIDVSLDKIVLLSKSNATPESKIKAYREAQIELAAVKEKMDKLKDLASAAGSVGTLFGFVGGAQTLAVWGLIIILATGFVFLSIYMRTLLKKEQLAVVPSPSGRGKKKVEVPVQPEDFGHHRSNFGLAAILALTLGIGLLAGVALGRVGSSPQVLGQTTQTLNR